MSAAIIDGVILADEIIAKVKKAAQSLVAEANIKPGIAVVIVGSDPASQVYVRSKGKKAEECDFHSLTFELAEDVNQTELLEKITELNSDPAIHGILVQLPLPGHIDENRIIQAIAPQKDVDGFHYINVGMLGTGALDQAFVPCTPAGSMVMIKKALGTDDLSGLNAVVVGRSNIVGKPMAHLLLAGNATVTIAHSRTKELPALCRNADILVAAVGRPQMIKGDCIKPGACVIDVGINRIETPEKGKDEKGNIKTRLVGDVDFDAIKQIAGSITPVPGGVGKMTIAMLMANTLIAACRSAGVKPPQF